MNSKWETIKATSCTYLEERLAIELIAEVTTQAGSLGRHGFVTWSESLGSLGTTQSRCKRSTGPLSGRL